MLHTLIREARQTLRGLWKSPGYLAAAVLTLGLGIGAGTSIFSFVDGILLEPMPYREPERLLFIWDGLDWIGVPEAWVAGPEIARLREETSRFEGFAALRSGGVALAGETEEPRQVQITLASANLFDLLGVRPALGRGFVPGEDRPDAEPVVLLGHELWRGGFGGDPGVLGRTVLVDGSPATIVGVMPPGFRFSQQSSLGAPVSADLYAPLRVSLADAPIGNHQYAVLARVRADASMQDARSELAELSRRLDREIYGDRGFHFVPAPLHERLVQDVRPALIALFGAVGLLLLIMCSNLTVLALGRAARRGREIAVRRALGAGGLRIAGRVMTETLAISLLGGALGLVLAVWGVDGLIALAPEGLPRRAEIGIDARVAAFALVLAVMVALAIGLLPAVRSAGRDLAPALRERASTGGGRRLRDGLVAVQVALSLVLLVTAGLLTASFTRLLRVEPGFDPDGVLTVDVRPVPARYPDAADILQFYDRYLERLSVLPGVAAVGATSSPPLSAQVNQRGIRFPGSPANTGDEERDRALADEIAATPGYLAAMGIPLLEGRDFEARDHSEAPRVALIDRTLARRFFPDGGSVGSTVIVDGDTLTVVGVVGHARQYRIHEDDRGHIYRAHSQWTFRSMTVAIRGEGDPHGLAAPAHDVLRSIDPLQPITRIRSMPERVAESLAERRLVLILLGGFAAAALLLASLGIYGVVSGAVIERTREMGIRMALGARANRLIWWVLGRGMLPAALGLTLGLVATFWATSTIESLLYRVPPVHPGTFGAAAAVLLGVALIAAYIPARRASRVDPVIALRDE